MHYTKDGNEVNAVTDSSIKEPLNITPHETAANPIFLQDNSHERIFKDAMAFMIPVQYQANPKSEPKVEAEATSTERPRFQDKMNTRALPEHAKTYQLEKFEKKAMIIFNQENIDGYLPRKGTNEDEKALRHTFSNLGFEIEPPHKDLTKAELFNVLGDFSDRDFTDYGCVVIVILTHGNSQGLLRAKDEGQMYNEKDIIDQFKTQSKPTLITKPVILIIQACRGTSSTKGVSVMQKIKISRDHDEETTPYYLPVEADMLIFHSSFIGKPSYRPENGSWFIQTLCKQINELYRLHDFESICTEIKREVAIEKYYMERNRVTEEMEVNKQMPVVTSTLIRKLFLRRFNDNPPKFFLPYMQKSSPGNTSAGSSSSNSEEQCFETCYCFLDHFGYLKTCLSHIVQRHPQDAVARSLLSLARFESGVNDEKAKATLILISNHLQRQYKNLEFHKFIYFYESGREIEFETIIDKDSARDLRDGSALRNFTKTWSEWSQSYVLRGLGTCVGAYVIYNLIKYK